MTKEKYIKITKNVIMFFMYFIWAFIPSLILNLFNIDPSKFSNIGKNIYLIISDLLYIILLGIVYKGEIKEDFIKYKNNYKKIFIKYFKVYLLGVILMGITNTLAYKITGSEISNNEELVRNYIKYLPFYMSFSTVIYAPIVEEFTFRKIIRNIISNKLLFIIMSGIIFGLLHMSSSYEINDYIMIIPYVVMGICLAYIYSETDTIFSSITFHALHNLILLIIQFLG